MLCINFMYINEVNFISPDYIEFYIALNRSTKRNKQLTTAYIEYSYF